MPLLSASLTMDLGFGNSNQVVGGTAAKVILQTTKAQEQAVQQEIDRYDALLQDDDALEDLRAKRLHQMKKAQEQRQKWQAAGHGTYTELGAGHDSRDVGRDFFEASKQSERLVVHFYRPSTRLCDIFHAHLAKLAPRRMETRFVKVNVENCDKEGGGASFLVERLGIVVMPTIVIVKDRKAVHHIRGFDELGGTDDFSTSALEYVLGVHGAIRQNESAEIPRELVDPKGVNAIRIKGSAHSSLHRGIYETERDED